MEEFLQIWVSTCKNILNVLGLPHIDHERDDYDDYDDGSGHDSDYGEY